MSTSALAGSGSVIDVYAIVNQLMTIEQRPVAAAKKRVSSVDVSISAMSRLKGLVDKVGSSAKALEDQIMLSGRSVSSSDSALLRATVSNSASASPGTFAVKNTVLAKSQRTAFPSFASNAPLSGTFTLQNVSNDFAGQSVVAGTSYRVVTLGSSTLAQWQASFTQVGGAELTAIPGVGDTIEARGASTLTGGGSIVPSVVTIALTGATGTLEGLRDAFNSRADLSGKISASIVNTGQDVDTVSVAATGRYRVASAGNSTLAQWQQYFTQVGGGALISIPQVGDTVEAAAPGTLQGGGTVSAATSTVASGKTYQVADPGSTTLAVWQASFTQVDGAELSAIPNVGDVLVAKTSGSITGSASFFPQDKYIFALSAAKTGSTATFTAVGTAGSGLVVNPLLGQASANATAEVNGLAVASKSNSFTEAIPGVSFDILKADVSVAGATASITDNRATLKDRLKSFAADLTALNQGLSTLTKPGSKDEQAGPLAGNSGITGLRLAISSAYSSGFTITGASGAGNAYRWADLGLEVNRDGSVTIRQSDLDKAIDGITMGYGAAREIGREMLGGFTSTVRTALDSFRGAAGTIQGSLGVLQTNRSRLSTNVSELESKVERTRKSLFAKYAALDAKLAGLSQVSANVRSSLGRLSG